ncbi:Cytochrome P450 3A1 like protein [Argiope bruennichi]|uniref:Cytochrome P450 3A1 like protein n=1 Tax=Argiope bruennichi TaxID=94029 RepID=A0A8T0F9A7_ARGBR|nr:Cytochrome P450 3A1 like protein [Argiope bruennichi]
MEFLTEPTTITLFLGIIFFLLLYWHYTKDFDYWKKRGIPYVKPLVPVFGSSYQLLWKPSHEIDLERYRKLGPIYGQFDGNRPVLAIADLKLIREVLVKEFPSFMNRRVSYFVSGSGIVELMLFALQGDEWKRVRGILSPNFTTGKIKRMVSIIRECGQTMIENFKAAAKTKEPVEIKQIYGAFSMDVIASSAFSVKLDSYNNPKNEFVQSAKKAFSKEFSLKLALFQLFPRIAKLIGVQVLSYPSVCFYRKVILQMMEQRTNTKETRNDFLQLLMAAVKGSTEEQKEDLVNDKDDITANYGQDESTHKIIKNFSNKSKYDSAVLFSG